MDKLLPSAGMSHAVAANGLRAEIYREMSPSQKWKEAARLRETAWKMKAAGIRAAHPAWNDQEVEKAVREIFLYAVT